MKINKRLTIGGIEQNLISEDVHLAVNWIGKARFTVQRDSQVFGPIKYQIGYAQYNTMHTYFTGAIDSCIEVSNGKWEIIAREYLAALDGPTPLALRHVTLKQVLAQITSITGIKFVTPDKPYANTTVPFFYHVGTATQQLQAIGRAFSIPDYVWFQQDNGTCFVGSYQDSHWLNKTIDVNAQQTLRVDGQSIELPIIPAIKPGVVINNRRITQLNASGSKMVVKW